MKYMIEIVNFTYINSRSTNIFFVNYTHAN